MFGSIPFSSGRTAGHPWVAWGQGDPLLVIPGLNDPLARARDHWWFDVLAGWFCRRLSRACAGVGMDRKVFYVSRPVGLSGQATTRSLARGYVPVVEALDDGSGVDVVGISMGGFLAPALATHSARIRSVTLALAADRLSPHGLTSIRTWREWAAREEWQRVGRAGTRAVARGVPRVAGALGARVWDFAGGPTQPDDFLVSAAACLDHEWTAPLDTPTLIIGGTQDPFFTDAAFVRAADTLDARHARLEGWGHDVVVHGPETFDRAIAGFIARPA